MAAVAAAVTGDGTPASAAVTARPERATLWALILAGPAISSMLCGIVLLLVYVLWPDVVKVNNGQVMRDIVQACGAIALVLSSILGVVVFRLASGGLKKVEAKAGPAGINIETGGG
jgi:fumarate reductase subunit D